jgi:membrane-associated phospholipid phosphatase
VLALCLLAPPAGAASEPLQRPSYDLAVDGAVTGAAAIGTLTLELLKNDLAPLTCKWCSPGSIDGDLSGSAAWSNPHAADTASTLLTLAVPAGMLAYGLLQAYQLGDPGVGWADVLLVAEAASVAMLVNTTVKYAVGRARPYVWQGQPGLYDDPSDRNLSFFSGHATFAFAVAVSAGTLFLMQDLPGAPVVLGAGLAAAVLVGYLRMAADQHYLTDVLTGAAVGSLVGWAVPYLFHRPGKKATEPGALMPAPGGIAIAW